MPEFSARRFYDELASGYHLLYSDWGASMARQAQALDGLIRGRIGDGPHEVLDCACGIGTQAIGLAMRGHHVTGSDLSAGAVTRAAREAAARGARLAAVVGDMRRPAFQDGRFEAVVCADNSLAHLLTPGDARDAVRGMRRVLCDGGLLLLGMRDYEQVRRDRRPATAPQVTPTAGGRAISFQLWDWHDDGERYDLQHFQLVPHEDTWRVDVRRATSWAMSQAQVTAFVEEAGFDEVAWHDPDETGFFQPVLTARAERGTAPLRRDGVQGIPPDGSRSGR